MLAVEWSLIVQVLRDFADSEDEELNDGFPDAKGRRDFAEQVITKAKRFKAAAKRRERRGDQK